MAAGIVLSTVWCCFECSDGLERGEYTTIASPERETIVRQAVSRFSLSTSGYEQVQYSIEPCACCGASTAGPRRSFVQQIDQAWPALSAQSVKTEPRDPINDPEPPRSAGFHDVLETIGDFSCP